MIPPAFLEICGCPRLCSMDSSPQQANSGKKAPAIRELYPTLTDQELKEAEKNFHRYVEIALEIHDEQLCGAANPGIDTCPHSPTIKERSNFSLKN